MHVNVTSLCLAYVCATRKIHIIKRSLSDKNRVWRQTPSHPQKRRGECQEAQYEMHRRGGGGGGEGVFGGSSVLVTACCQATQCVPHRYGNSCLVPTPPSKGETLSVLEEDVGQFFFAQARAMPNIKVMF